MPSGGATGERLTGGVFGPDACSCSGGAGPILISVLVGRASALAVAGGDHGFLDEGCPVGLTRQVGASAKTCSRGASISIDFVMRAILPPPQDAVRQADAMPRLESVSERLRARRSGSIMGWQERKWLSGRAPPCQGGGRGFESRLPLHFFARRFPLGARRHGQE